MTLNSTLKQFFSAALGFFLIFLIGAFLFFSQTYYQQPLIPAHGTAIDYYFANGKTTRQVAADLEQAHLLSHPQLLIFILKILHKDADISAGEYRLEPGITLAQFVKKLVNKEVLRYPYTLVEGWTTQQALNELKKQSTLTHQLNSNYQTIPLQGYFKYAPTLEGAFFPDTYLYIKGSRDIDILMRAHAAMVKKLDALWRTRTAKLPYQNPYQALIVASLIEKETAQDAERSLIAGVILNRLALKMPLQIDASVIYGLGSSMTTTLTHHDLKKNTPYNTYLHRGLPPTPIANPGYPSLYAAFHPAMTQKLYYVSKGDGNHYFSENFSEHHRAVTRYLKKKTK